MKRHVTAAVVLLLGLTACHAAGDTGAAPSSAPITSPAASPTGAGTTAATPALGQCRLESEADIAPASNDTPTVPCSEPHTSVTVAVLHGDGGQEPSKRVVDRFVGGTCAKAVAKAAGLARKDFVQSIITLSWFTPTATERAAGAGWVRCDLNAYTDDGHGDVRDLQQLPALPLAGGELPEALRLCFAGQAALTSVSCASPHEFRADDAFRVNTDGRGYPDSAGMRKLASRCHSLLGTTDYAYRSPSPADWAARNAWITCLAGSGGGVSV